MKTTQETHPWKSTIRTVFQALVGLAVIVPVIVEDVGATAPWALGAAAIAGGFARVMALPQVEHFLEDHLPWLAAQPKGER